MMKSKQAGFTLIELVVVIVILGILTATALPRLTSIDRDAKRAAVQGALAAVSSSAAITYANRHVSSSLTSIVANTTFTDPLFSINAGDTCANDLTNGTQSTVNGYYITDLATPAVSTLLASTILDAALCSG